MNLQQWANKRQFGVHTGIGAAVAIPGSAFATMLDANPLVTVMFGFYASVIWFLAKELTDETVHQFLKGKFVSGGQLWHGFSKSDFLQGVLGGFIGSLIGIAAMDVVRSILI